MLSATTAPRTVSRRSPTCRTANLGQSPPAMRLPRSRAIVVAASIVGCAVAPRRSARATQPARITDPTQRTWLRGFSVLPPNGSGWFAMPPVPADAPPPPIYLVARFAKVLDHADTPDVHTAAAEVH